MLAIVIPSPFADGLAEEIQKISTFTFRGQAVMVNTQVFRCIETGTQFTNDAQDEFFLEELERQYALQYPGTQL